MTQQQKAKSKVFRWTTEDVAQYERATGEGALKAMYLYWAGPIVVGGVGETEHGFRVAFLRESCRKGKRHANLTECKSWVEKRAKAWWAFGISQAVRDGLAKRAQSYQSNMSTSELELRDLVHQAWGAGRNEAVGDRLIQYCEEVLDWVAGWEYQGTISVWRDGDSWLDDHDSAGGTVYVGEFSPLALYRYLRKGTRTS